MGAPGALCSGDLSLGAFLFVGSIRVSTLGRIHYYSWRRACIQRWKAGNLALTTCRYFLSENPPSRRPPYEASVPHTLLTAGFGKTQREEQRRSKSIFRAQKSACCYFFLVEKSRIDVQTFACQVSASGSNSSIWFMLHSLRPRIGRLSNNTRDRVFEIITHGADSSVRDTGSRVKTIQEKRHHHEGNLQFSPTITISGTDSRTAAPETTAGPHNERIRAFRTC